MSPVVWIGGLGHGTGLCHDTHASGYYYTCPCRDSRASDWGIMFSARGLAWLHWRSTTDHFNATNRSKQRYHWLDEQPQSDSYISQQKRCCVPSPPVTMPQHFVKPHQILIGPPYKGRAS